MAQDLYLAKCANFFKNQVLSFYLKISVFSLLRITEILVLHPKCNFIRMRRSEVKFLMLEVRESRLLFFAVIYIKKNILLLSLMIYFKDLLTFAFWFLSRKRREK